VFEVIDRFVIDLLLVNGLALFVSAVGRVSRWVQNGQVQRYLAGVLIGAAAIFYFTTRVTADFEQVPHGAVVQFKADIGKGPSAGTKADPATIDWDFDGDGQPDDRYHGQLEPSVPRTDIVGDTVTLWFTDAVLGKRVKVVKKVHDVARGAAPPAGAGAGAADADADKGGAR
jgi:hypothetical protein